MPECVVPKVPKGASDTFDTSVLGLYENIHLDNTNAIQADNRSQKVLAMLVENNSEKERTNHWWLLHLKGAKTMEVCSWPFSTRREILAHWPQALEAEPIESPIEDSQAQAP